MNPPIIIPIPSIIMEMLDRLRPPAIVVPMDTCVAFSVVLPGTYGAALLTE